MVYKQKQSRCPARGDYRQNGASIQVKINLLLKI